MSETKSDKTKKALAKKYQKKTDIEHILDAPIHISAALNRMKKKIGC